MFFFSIDIQNHKNSSNKYSSHISIWMCKKVFHWCIHSNIIDAIEQKILKYLIFILIRFTYRCLSSTCDVLSTIQNDTLFSIRRYTVQIDFSSSNVQCLLWIFEVIEMFFMHIHICVYIYSQMMIIYATNCTK